MLSNHTQKKWNERLVYWAHEFHTISTSTFCEIFLEFYHVALSRPVLLPQRARSIYNLMYGQQGVIAVTLVASKRSNLCKNCIMDCFWCRTHHGLRLDELNCPKELLILNILCGSRRSKQEFIISCFTCITIIPRYHLEQWNVNSSTASGVALTWKTFT